MAQPFGNLLRFGNIIFNGPSGPLNINQDWITTPTEIVDAAYPIDPYGTHSAPMGIQKAVWDYALVLNYRRPGDWGLSYEVNAPAVVNNAQTTNLEVEPFGHVPPKPLSGQGAVNTGKSSLSAIEYQWNEMYMGFRQFNNQSAILSANDYILNTPATKDNALYSRARINTLELKLTPGKDTNSYVTKLEFVLLSEWQSLANGGNANATLASLNLGTPRKDIHVPFGNMISFAGLTFPTRGDITQPFMITSIVEQYNIEWDVQFSIMPHSSFPLDHFGVSPCPMKPIQATWELIFVSNSNSFNGSIRTGNNYSDLYNMYNNFLSNVRNGLQQGPLVVQDSNGNFGQCQARIKSFPLILTQANANYLSTKITFDIYSDWTYTVPTIYK